MSDLLVKIPANSSYGLFADGQFYKKSFQEKTAETILFFKPNAVIFLYFHYPNLRAATAIRNSTGLMCHPCLSAGVTRLFTVYGSKVTKLQKAVYFLNKKLGDAYNFSDDLYLRLYFILQKKGELNAYALVNLFKTFRKPV